MILRRIARPMLAAVFVSGGIQTLRDPKPPIQAVEPMLDKTVEQVRDRLPDQVPTDAESLVKLDAMIKIGAGLALAFNKFPRLASLLLAGTLIPTTVATHRFWEHEDPLERSEQQTHFLKNMGLLGGLLIASADTHGKPSLNWQARRAARRASGAVQGHVQHAAGAVQGAAGAVQGTVQSAAGAVQETVQSAAGAVQGTVHSAADVVQSATKKPVRKAKSLLPG